MSLLRFSAPVCCETRYAAKWAGRTNQTASPGIQNSPDRREHVGYDRYVPMTWSVGSVNLHGKHSRGKQRYHACDPSPDGSDVSRSTKPPKAGEMEGAFGSAPEAIFTFLQSVYFYHLPVLYRPEPPGANRNNRRLDASHSGIGTAIDTSLGLR
ncbi:hypothetical protein BGX38DRAFT_1143424 [Terfezia claveryi]|nr:hypothetical protein BGX38DRAFT_1143424 [Terfezia claveryi]